MANAACPPLTLLAQKWQRPSFLVLLKPFTKAFRLRVVENPAQVCAVPRLGETKALAVETAMAWTPTEFSCATDGNLPL
jgi:hypothetical protein